MSNRCCQVIAFWAGPRRVRPWSSDMAIKLLTHNWETHLSVDGGMEYDTIIVNAISGDKRTEEFLSEINGKNTKNGKLKVLHRENIGVSFGSHNYAYETFKNDYDYWFFTEDDAIFEKTGWYSKFYERLSGLMSDDKSNIAFVSGRNSDCNEDFYAAEREGRPWPGNWPPHAPGGTGMSHSKYLDILYEKNGMLPHRKTDGKSFNSGGYKMDALLCEIEFTGKFHELGYKIQYIGDVYYSRWWGKNPSGGEGIHNSYY